MRLIHQLTPPKKKAKAKPKPKVTYGVDSEGHTVELWDIPEPEPKKQALKANDRKSSGAQSRKANDRKSSGAQARKANTRKPAKKSIHQLTPSDVKKAKKAKKAKSKKSIHQLTPSDVPRKKSIHQLTPSDVHGGSEGTYIYGDQGGGGYVDTYDGAYSDSGEVSVSNLEGGSSASGPTWSGPSGGESGRPVINVYVQGSIRSDRDIVALIRDAFLNGGFRGVLPT